MKFLQRVFFIINFKNCCRLSVFMFEKSILFLNIWKKGRKKNPFVIFIFYCINTFHIIF